MTRLPYAEVIGDPIGHSRSPAIHGLWLSKLGIEAEYRATHVRREALADYFAARRADPLWRGCNITIPHKQRARALVDIVEDEGIGAINCVVPLEGRLVGRNTDLGGLDAALPASLGDDARIVLVGGGGAAAAALAALKGRRAACDLVVRKPDQGKELFEHVGWDGTVFGFEAAPQAIADSVGLINASPLGMSGFPPMPPQILAALDGMRSGAFVLDMVYVPIRTALLEAAALRRLVAIDGLEMLIGQAGLAFRYFFGAEAPRQDDAELRGLLLS
jgi:shikimate dehydrogenase